MKVLTSSQMFSAEQAQVNRGMSFTRLMENAGSACAREIRERFASLEQSRGLVCVLCGKGKNGGDGFVIARKLALAGFNVAVAEAFGEPTAEDSILMREKAVETGLVPEFFWGEENAKNSIESAAVIVDAVFGTGYKYREDERVRAVFEAVNASPAKVVSIDVPSGLESNNGDVPGSCIKADITIAVSCMKPVHILKPACVLCGEIITVAIGIDDDIIDGIEDDTLAVLTPAQAKKIFPRRDLMANISHDLRTPLTMVKAYAEMIRDLSGDDPEKRNEHLEIIIEESDRLAALVNDIMDLTKLENGTSELHKEPFCVGSRLREIMTRYKLLSERDGYKFYISVNDDAWAEADLIKFDQVIYNLVNNAVNYSGEEKSIYVMEVATPKKITISVTDTGDGIDKELMPLIFDRYYRAEKHKREVIGTGLGLSIVKQIFILHGFQFGVKSEEGIGSTFWFEMDRVQPPKDEEIEEKAE